MAISTRRNILNIRPGSIPVIVHLSQGDVGSTIEFYMYDGSEPFYSDGYQASVHGIRQDGVGFGPYDVIIVAGENRVNFNVSEEMTAISGAGLAELIFTDSQGNSVGSANFALLVEKGTFPLSPIYSNDISVYQQILNYVQTIPASVRSDYIARIATVQNNLNAEITARQNAISTEASARAAAVSAEASARQSADNTLQSNINAEASTRATQDASLQSQIDQLIAPSGEAPSAAEVENARIGSDGTVYPTLGDAIRTQNSLLKSQLGEDDVVIGVHRIVLTSTTHVAFSVPKDTTLTIRTVDGTNLPSNRLNLYDANDNSTDWFSLGDTYGNSRTVIYNKVDAAYVALNSSSNKRIMVIWYDDKDLSKNVVALTKQSVTVNENLDIISNGYYNYSQWDNVAWSRNNSGNRYPYRATNANRASFPELLFVRAGTKVHIEGYSGQKYGYGAWTYDPVTEMYTNTVTTTVWYTESFDWILAEDSYITVAVANADDTTAIPVNTVGVTVSIYDSKIYDHEKRLDALQEVIPSKFVTEMDATIASVRNALTEPCLVIPMVTDIHYAPNTSVFQNFDDTIMLIKHFVKNVACDMTVNLGDNINGNSDQTLMLGYAYYMMSAFNNIGIPYLFTIGNHDTNYDPGEKFTLAETFSAFYSATKNVVYNPDTKTDYYKDIDDLGIRIVSINTQYLNAYVISTDTVSWFENIALDTDKTVILLTHQALIATQAWDNRIPSRSADIVNAVNAFINNGGTLIQFCGHVHCDCTFTTPWLNFCLACGKFISEDTTASGYQAITGYDGTLSSPSRTVGDATEQAWSVVVIRPLAKKVNVIRFGAGSDREYTYGS